MKIYAKSKTLPDKYNVRTFVLVTNYHYVHKYSRKIMAVRFVNKKCLLQTDRLSHVVSTNLQLEASLKKNLGIIPRITLPTLDSRFDLISIVQR